MVCFYLRGANPAFLIYFMRFILFCFIFLFSIEPMVQAQTPGNHTVSGFIREAATGESLLGANVYIKENLKGVTTNSMVFIPSRFLPGNTRWSSPTWVSRVRSGPLT